MINKLKESAFHALSQNDMAKAVECYNKILQHDPNDHDANHILAFVCDLQGQHEEALKYCYRAINSYGCRANYYSTLSNIYRHLENYQEAITAASTACDLRPDDALYWNNGAMLMAEIKQYDRARAAYEYALELAPDSAYIHFNYSLLLLTLEEDNGWDEYEWRIPFNYNSPKPTYPKDLNGKNIVIRHEQGFGDFLMCARYFKALEKLGAKVFLETPRVLNKLFPSSFCSKPDLVINTMSLPCLIKEIPNEPYLDIAKTIHNGFNIGIAHKAVKKFNNDVKPIVNGDKVQFLVHPANLAWLSAKKRSLPEDWFDPLISNTHTFHNLQIDAPHHKIPTYEGIQDFADLAKAVEKMDLIITIDTALTHLAGAMGKPTWLLLPYDSEWRWGTKDTTKWYPSVKIFRCPTRGDWDSVKEDVRCALTKLSPLHAVLDKAG